MVKVRHCMTYIKQSFIAPYNTNNTVLKNYNRFSPRNTFHPLEYYDFDNEENPVSLRIVCVKKTMCCLHLIVCFDYKTRHRLSAGRCGTLQLSRGNTSYSNEIVFVVMQLIKANHGSSGSGRLHVGNRLLLK